MVRVKVWEKKDRYAQVIALASHRVHAVKSFSVENDLTWNGSSIVAHSDGITSIRAVTEGSAANALAMGSGAYWTASSRFTGCAYLALDWKIDSKAWPQGIPARTTTVVEGCPLYDPRRDSTQGGSGSHRADDQSTWQYYDGATEIGRNPALALLAWLIGYRIKGKVAWGMGIPLDRINLSNFAAYANLCEERVQLAGGGTTQRYTCDGILATTDTHESAISAITAAMGCAKLTDVAGLYTLVGGFDDTASPKVAFFADDLVSAPGTPSPYVWLPAGSPRETYNIVRGRYADPSQQYQLVDWGVVETDALADGVPRTLQLDLGMVSRSETCQRIAKQFLLREALTPGTFTGVFGPKAFLVQVGSLITLSLQERGWNNKLFRVIEQSENHDLLFQMSLREEDPQVYAWDKEEKALPANIRPGAYNAKDTIVPAGLTLTATSVAGVGGINTSQITVSWTAETSTRVAAMQIESRLAGGSVWTEQAANADPAAGAFRFSSDNPGKTVEVRARYRMTSGVYSAYVSASVLTEAVVINYPDVVGAPQDLEALDPESYENLSQYLQTPQALLGGPPLSPGGRAVIKQYLSTIVEPEYRKLRETAVAMKIGVDYLDASYNALVGYFAGLPNWNSTTGTTTVNTTVYEAKKADYENYRNIVQGYVNNQLAAPPYTYEWTPSIGNGGTLTGNNASSTANNVKLLADIRYQGEAHFKCKLELTGDVKVGLSTATDGSINYGFRLTKEGATWRLWRFAGSTETFIKTVTEAVIVVLNYTAGTVVWMTPQDGYNYPAQTLTGEPDNLTLGLVGVLQTGAQVGSIMYAGANGIAYDAIVGPKPPVDATIGSNVAQTAVNAIGTSPIDAEGYYTFDSYDQMYIVGSAGESLRATGESYLKITVDIKDDTGVGDAIIGVLAETSNGTKAFSVDARRGGGTITMPLGTTKYKVYHKVSFSSGSIKMRRAVVTPTEDAGTAGTGNNPATDDGIDITTISRLLPSSASRAAFGEYGMYAPGGSDSNQVDMRNGDKVAWYSGAAVAGPDAFAELLGARFIFINIPNIAANNPGNGVGSVVLTVYSANPTNGQGAQTLASYTLDSTSARSDIITIPAGHTLFRIEMAASVSSGFIRTALPNSIMLRRNRSVDNQVVIDLSTPVTTEIATPDFKPSFFFSYTHPADPTQTIWYVEMIKERSAVALPGSGTVKILTSLQRDVATNAVNYIGQMAEIDGITYTRSWRKTTDASGTWWDNPVAIGPDTSSNSGWAKIFSAVAGAQPTIGETSSDIVIANPDGTTSPATTGDLVTSEGTAANTVLVAATLAYTVESQAAKIANVPIPVIEAPSFLSTANPMPLYTPRISGGANVSPLSDWTMTKTAGVTASINNIPNDPLRGKVSLSGLELPVSYISTTSTYMGSSITDVSRLTRILPKATDTALTDPNPSDPTGQYPQYYPRISRFVTDLDISTRAYSVVGFVSLNPQNIFEYNRGSAAIAGQYVYDDNGNSTYVYRSYLYYVVGFYSSVTSDLPQTINIDVKLQAATWSNVSSTGGFGTLGPYNDIAVLPVTGSVQDYRAINGTRVLSTAYIKGEINLSGYNLAQYSWRLAAKLSDPYADVGVTGKLYMGTKSGIILP